MTRGSVANSTVTVICGMPPEQVVEMVRLAASPNAADHNTRITRLNAILPATFTRIADSDRPGEVNVTSPLRHNGVPYKIFQGAGISGDLAPMIEPSEFQRPLSCSEYTILAFFCRSESAQLGYEAMATNRTGAINAPRITGDDSNHIAPSRDRM
jgi:hypothetical protein